VGDGGLGPALAVSEADGVETDRSVSFRVSLSHPSPDAVTVDYATRDETATAGTDYGAVSGQILIPAGDLGATVEVPIRDDAVDERTERFLLLLSDPVGATIGDWRDGAGEAAIDDDEPQTLSIDDIRIEEGNGGTRNATFRISVSTPAEGRVTVDWATEDGTARAGPDYVAASGQATIPIDVAAATVSVAVNGDVLDEPDETFSVRLTNPTGAILADDQGVATIVDDDPTPTISIDDVRVQEGAPGDKPRATFTVRLSSASGRDVTVRYGTADGTATAPADYTAASGTLTLPAGSASGVVSVVVRGDAIDEPDETFFVNLSQPVGATIFDAHAIGTIVDDDEGGPAPGISIDDATVTEGAAGSKASAWFRISVSSHQGGDVTVHWATADGTAVAPSDYTGAGGIARIPAGQTSATVRVVIRGDAIDEPDETFFVNLSDPIGATITDGQGVGTIVDDD
jgi:hypothetical protein